MARIAFLIPDLGGGGAERVALNLIKGFVERGHQVDLVLAGYGGVLLPGLPPTVTVIEFAAPQIRDVLRPLVRYLRDRRPEAMVVSMWPLTVVGLLAGWLSRTGVRVVTSDHTTLSKQYGPVPRTFRAMRWTIRWLYPRASGRIIVSDGAADDLAALSGLPRASIRVVPNPIPPVAVEAAAVERAAAHWRGATARLIAVGKFKPEKNFDLVLRACAALDPAIDWRLVLLGEGPLGGAMTELARDLGIADRVVMPGFDPEPAPWFEAADLFVLSSDFEGLPTVLVEALHAGCAIVSTDCRSGPREILGADSPELVPCRDAPAMTAAIARALAHPPDRTTQRARGLAASGLEAVDDYLALLGVGAAE